MIPDVAERTAELPEICKRYHVARLDLFMARPSLPITLTERMIA